ncbi:uncharacterized protein A4U43_C08F23470 [Asparagus officinalis]|nr:uncharacterized protein A4U43_C08F23470 [Asparagus officinalis]
MSVREFKAWLQQFDSDHDGRISRAELRHALRDLGSWFAWWKARQGLKHADGNRDGKVDQEEIAKLIAYAQQKLHINIYAIMV